MLRSDAAAGGDDTGNNAALGGVEYRYEYELILVRAIIVQQAAPTNL